MKLKHDDENTAAEDEEGNNATDVPGIEVRNKILIKTDVIIFYKE